MVETLNPGCKLDLSWIEKSHVNYQAIKKRAKYLEQLKPFATKEHRIAWLLKAITLIDLTTLSGDDTDTNVTRLCHKASRPLTEKLSLFFGFDQLNEDCQLRTAAVCVYPSRVKCAAEIVNKLNLTHKLQVAAVATGFPTGQYPLHTRIAEIQYAIEQGATEIDIVIDRSLVINSKWEQLYNEISEMKKVCDGKAHMKCILAIGELSNAENIYKASLIAMMAGSDFIKTSTGKESINATLPVGIIMSRAILDYYDTTGFRVGLKPAGGIRTANDAISWLIMVKEELGDYWLNNKQFRFGASGLLGDIEQELYLYATTRYPAPYQFKM
ncbi:deoxyribose-phosphate aldolase [Chrysoperla carnea]|uniref:deoxyribose-phosphate aldolase n=1 Tax=Chrysoperla carnea TaxID=189513 RepID=UPI001D06A5D7|nr:deoxyribose-phosphate aldolase [Chrysoperla carnea]